MRRRHQRGHLAHPKLAVDEYPQLAGLESSDYVRWREIEAQVTKGEAPIVPTANTEPTALQSKPEGSQP